MKNSKKILLAVFFTLFLVPFISVSAKEIETLDATENNGVITVKGTAEAGTYAVAIMVYDSTETNLVEMKTTSVASDNSFIDTINVSSGTYVVKVADYNGGNYATKKVTASSKNSSSNVNTTTDKNTNTNNANNPKTGDNFILYICILIVSLLGITASIIYVRKNKKAKNK